MLLFTPNPDRVHQALAYAAWITRDGLDLGTLGTGLLVADALHLADYGRPTTGDIWDGEPPAPLGRIARRLLNREPCTLAMLTPAPESAPDLPRYALDHGRVVLRDAPDGIGAHEDSVFRHISESDRVVLRAAFGQAESDEIDAARARALHAWRRALGGVLDYAEMLPADVRNAPGFEEHADLAPRIVM